MFPTIVQIINDALDAKGLGSYKDDYRGLVDAVASDVSIHVSKVANDLLDRAGEEGFNVALVRAAFVEAGLLTEPDPEPEVEAEPVELTDEVIEERLSKIEAQVTSLVALAERHLGSLSI